MVLSTTKMTSSIQSIANSNQGGGPNKPGLLPSVRDIRTKPYLNARGLPQSMTLLNTWNGVKVYPHRDIGMSRVIVWR
jgi:hypothetical protein